MLVLIERQHCASQFDLHWVAKQQTGLDVHADSCSLQEAPTMCTWTSELEPRSNGGKVSWSHVSRFLMYHQAHVHCLWGTHSIGMPCSCNGRVMVLSILCNLVWFLLEFPVLFCNLVGFKFCFLSACSCLCDSAHLSRLVSFVCVLLPSLVSPVCR